VARVTAFRALRYAPEVAGPLERLVSPPYDVISPAEREELLRASPYNAVHLILPEVPYERVGALIADWTRAGVLRRSEAPELVAWTQTFGTDGNRRERRTLLAAVGLEEYGRRVVRPHERTHEGPKADRLRLMRAVGANLSPVFGLYPDPQGAAWAAAGVSGSPEAELTDREGTTHRLWWVGDRRACEAVVEALADRWILIADGHHRYETALAYRAEHPAADRVLMGLTSLDDPGLVILPTHRVLREWPEGAGNGLERVPATSLPKLLEALRAAPPGQPAFGLVRPDGVALLAVSLGPGDSPAARIDAAALEREVLLPAFGADQAALTASGVLSYTSDADEAAGLVRSGAAQAAILLRPPTAAQVAAVAEAGETMPQKSTYFFPKLLTGVAFRPLDE
jgi:uncharacterized protein (DUF1015 family)